MTHSRGFSPHSAAADFSVGQIAVLFIFQGHYNRLFKNFNLFSLLFMKSFPGTLPAIWMWFLALYLRNDSCYRYHFMCTHACCHSYYSLKKRSALRRYSHSYSVIVLASKRFEVLIKITRNEETLLKKWRMNKSNHPLNIPTASNNIGMLIIPVQL